MKITVSANAKINLFLDICGKRDDGYHTLNTVMHTIDLKDSVDVAFSDNGKINIKCSLPYIPTDERNIAYKSANAFLTKIGTKQGVFINLRKNIPVAGGLGGSSTDGAAVLSGLNYIFGKPLSEDELMDIASSLSADMPFCLKKGAALCEGIGDIITPIPTLNAFAVIIKPPYSFNSKTMFTLFDSKESVKLKSASDFLDIYKTQDIKAISKNMYNAFYPLAESIDPDIENFRQALISSGGDNAILSGSGSCLFAIFERKSAAENVYEKLKHEGYETYLSRLI